jgi:hypothetical protein
MLSSITDNYIIKFHYFGHSCGIHQSLLWNNLKNEWNVIEAYSLRWIHFVLKDHYTEYIAGNSMDGAGDDQGFPLPAYCCIPQPPLLYVSQNRRYYYQE